MNLAFPGPAETPQPPKGNREPAGVKAEKCKCHSSDSDGLVVGKSPCLACCLVPKTKTDEYTTVMMLTWQARRRKIAVHDPSNLDKLSLDKDRSIRDFCSTGNDPPSGGS
jgi:hypothetical protein